MVSPFEIGASVVGSPTTFQTPLSGHRSPVRAVVPMGTFVAAVIIVSLFRLADSTEPGRIHFAAFRPEAYYGF